MKRRDFLLLRTEGSERIADLSCERLFMHFQDLNAGFQQGNKEEGIPDDADWWSGEPALHINTSNPDTFFSNVLDDLKEIDSIQVEDMEWLAQGEFRVRVETLLTAFKARGGVVVYKTNKKVEVEVAD